MLRTYFQQNEDWFANSDHSFPGIGEMDSEIAELRTMTKVTRLRKQIECREEGAWMVVKDIPDENAASGSRKVTAYGRTRRSVVRSISSNADFGNPFTNDKPTEPLVQLSGEDEDEVKTRLSKPSAVEITEVYDEPLRVNVPEDVKPQNVDKPSQKKTSVVTLGKGNLVLIDPEENESNFQVTGISKGKVADVISTLERNTEKKQKKVGFSKTEVHFAPDSGKINIVETDEKPPPTHIYRKKKRSRGGVKSKGSNCLPKHYFGDMSDLGDDSNLSNESDKEESRPSLTFTHHIEVVPEVKQIFPTFEKTIKSENKDVKYRHSSPEKSDPDFGLEKSLFEEKDLFKKLKQPSFREKFLKESESITDNLPSISQIQFRDSTPDKVQTHSVKFNESEKTLNGILSRHKTSNDFLRDKFADFSISDHSQEKDTYERINDKRELKYTELFKISKKADDKDNLTAYHDLKNVSDVINSRQNEVQSEKHENILSKNEKVFQDSKTYDFYEPTSRVTVDQDIKPDISFIGGMSPKLKNLIKNSVEHEFQLRQKQILQKKGLEKKPIQPTDSNKIKSSVSIRVTADGNNDEKPDVAEETKLKPVKAVTQIKLENGTKSKHEFQLKREEITKNLFSEPIYDKKEFEFKETPYLLREEPIPAPRSKNIVIEKEELTNREPPKPKPRNIITSGDKGRSEKLPSRNSVKSETLSRRVRSRDNLSRSRDGHRISSRNSQNKDEVKPRKVSSTRIESGSHQRSVKAASIHSKKVVRGEPLRSFEKVSNGWVGHIVPTKQEDNNKTNAKLTVTTKVHGTKTLAQHSTHHSSGVRRSTHSSILKSSQSSRSDTSRNSKQFSLSREHLSSAKLVKEAATSPKKSSARTTKTEVRIIRPKTASASKEGSYGRVRRDSNDSVVQADEEVRGYMFNSRTTKGLDNCPVLKDSFRICRVL